MRYQRLDLNLLAALDVLLEERSVSLAADRLCLSQSATSSALGRLREYFGDDLMILKGRQMILTPRAEELIEPVRSVLEQIRTTIAIAPEFDPETCDRQIRIMASDYSTEVLLADALAELETVAPLMRFEIIGMASSPIETLERGMTDLLLTVDFALSSDHPSEILFHDDYVVVGDPKHDAIQGEMTRERYFELGHVTTRFGKARIPAFDDWFLRRQKQSRQIEVIAPTFLSLSGLLLGTNRIATMHRKLAMRVCSYLPLAMKEVPFEIPPIREGIQWHLANKNDFAIQWTIGQLRTVALNLYGKAGGSDVPGFHERIGVEFQADQQGKST